MVLVPIHLRSLQCCPRSPVTAIFRGAPKYQMMSNMRLLLSWNCPLVHEHSTDRLRSARLPRRRRVHFSDMGKGLTAFFLGKTNPPPSLDLCVPAFDIAGFTETPAKHRQRRRVALGRSTAENARFTSERNERTTSSSSGMRMSLTDNAPILSKSYSAMTFGTSVTQRLN